MHYLIILLILFSASLTAQPLTDIDKDDDGLIEVSNLETLNAMRYRLDGSGLQRSSATAVITTGCAVGGCKGYELTRDLDFNDVASYQNLANMKLWTTDAGWQPIGTAEQPFTAIFKTNNSSTPNTIFNLKINRADENNVGLFGHIGSTAEISGIGLLDVKVEGHHQVGGLVGKNAGGRISNSYANGNVVGKGGAVGLLVGHSSGSITNSYANGEVSGEANGIGGLVGANHGEIANSYAMGSVVGSANNVGGLVGDNMQGTIKNCYTTGSVSGSEDIGGLVGLSNLGTLTSNYVSGKASGTRYIGGLVGSNIGGTITQSYWDKTASKLEGNTGGVGLLASEMQSANAQDEDLKKPYYKWSTAHWDFGTAEQYPILKYATGSDLNNPVCGPEQTLPNCGALLLGQHASLKRILFLSDVNLIPNFKPTELNYQLGITTGTKTLQLIPIASNPDSSINISRNGIVIDSDLANGTTSSVITLGENTEIVIEVSAANQRPAQYSLTTHYLQEITILGIPDKAIDEGESIILDASQNLEIADTLLSYRWTQSSGKTLFPPPDSEGAILWLDIPEDYVSATAEYANLGLTLEINDGKATLTKDITLTIAKVDNGNIPIEAPRLDFPKWTAAEIDLDKDPDGNGKDFSYQWQSRSPGQDAKWTDIDKATEKTHTISFLTESYTEYRVLINYIDGQGYKSIAASRIALYVPKITILDFIKDIVPGTIPEDAKPQRTFHSTTATDFNCNNEDIDDDGDGLIDICDLEALNAMRHVMDGSGYQKSSTASKITTGCPTITVNGESKEQCKGYELIKDLDFNDDASYSSTPNKVIWTTGEGWQPIGYYKAYNNKKSFKAIFEGNGHTISNLMIDRPNASFVGLFGSTEGGTINNVGLLEVYIKGDDFVGGLAGFYGGTITKSYVTGVVKGGYAVGGLVGRIYGGTITDSYAASVVKGVWGRVGGLVGDMDGGTITNSYATGDVKEGSLVGGLVGHQVFSEISSSYATGTVGGDNRVGGLVGHQRFGEISSSYATGTTTGTSSVGGLVGLSYYASSIDDSYAMGDVKGKGSNVGGLVGHNYFESSIDDSYAMGDVEGGSYVGGLVGLQYYGGISSSYATGTTTGTSSVGGLVGYSDHYSDIWNSYATGAVNGGEDYVGGLAGFNGGGITNSYATGAVNGGEDYVGGLVGSSGGTIASSYATGSVTGTGNYVGGLVGVDNFDSYSRIWSSYATGAVNGGEDYVGGLVGSSGGTIASSYAMGSVNGGNSTGGLVGYSRDSDITNSYATGIVTGTGNGVGGLVGRRGNSGTISYSYWDTETSRQMSSAGGIGKTTRQLQSPRTSTGIYRNWGRGWDFGTSEQYPALKYYDGTLLPLQRFVRLEQLTVSPGTLQFDPPTYDYNVTVDQDVDSITLNTTATGATIHIASNTSGVEYNTTNTSSVMIPLTIAGDTIITIELTEGKQRPTRYTITVSHNIPDNSLPPLIKVTINQDKLTSVIDEIPVNEGQQVELDTDPSSCTLVNVKCQLRIPVYSSLLSDPSILNFTIPDNFVEANQSTQKLVVVFSTKKDGEGENITSKETTFVVSKVDNGSISIGQPTLFGSQLIAPDLLGDPEGVQKSSVVYQWQKHKAGRWVDIGRATARTYTPGDMSGGEEYRVRISYTDRQGHKVTLDSEATRGDIDVNGNGLIEIRYINDLDAMRYVRDGSGYQKSSTASKITTGCPEDGCKGYELVVDLDFNDNDSYSSTSNKVMWTTGEGWLPIGSTNMRNQFSGKFNGNNHTISNLMINRKHSFIGLFAMMNSSALIDGIDLYKVNIKGNDYVGALVGKNAGGIIRNSSVSGDNNTISTVVGTGKKVGGLVGINDNYTKRNPITVTAGKVINSFADVHVIGVIPDSGDDGSFVGGLIGVNKGIISNSYAAGNVSGNEDIGGLVGRHEGGEITNSYATGTIAGTSYVGGLVGLNSSGNIMHSYWDTQTSKIKTSVGGDGEGKTTAELQSPMTATEIYSSWSEEIWDFGTNKQYPALKNNDGTLLAGQRLGLQSLELSDKAILGEVFENTTYSYIIFVAHGAETIQTTPTAADPDAEITLSTSDDSNETTQESGHHQINLAEDTSTVTIVVKANNREVTYTFAMERVEIQGGDNIMHNEGDSKVSLNASVVGGVINLDQIQDDWRWEQIEGKPLLATTTTQRIQFPIPVNYVVGDASSATVTLKVTGIFTRGDEELRSSAEVELTINKEDNGHLMRLLNAPRLEEATELNDLHLVAPDLSDYVSTNRETDPDNGINADKITYQWQSLPPGSNSWSNIGINGDKKTYEIPHTSPFNTQYRVKLGYTDGQGHTRGIVDGEDRLVSQAITVKHVDRDNNGLIDIFSAEALAAIRHQLDGSSYKKSSTSTETITTGCPVNEEQQRQCNGYELKAHIDLKPTTDTRSHINLQPIGNANNPFNTIFNGNHYTISNLTIDSPDSDNVGLFGTTTRTAEIRNVGLLSVTKIAGRNNVGGLIGSNQGKVIGSYVIVAKREGRNIYGGNNVGGLIGHNEGKVVGSYVIAVKGDGTNIYGADNVGGLVGFNSNTTITESYAIVREIVSATDSVGGLVGKTSGGEISNSYATVNYMKGKLFTCEDGLIGKLVGTNDAGNPSAIIESKMIGSCGRSPLFD